MLSYGVFGKKLLSGSVLFALVLGGIFHPSQQAFASDSSHSSQGFPDSEFPPITSSAGSLEVDGFGGAGIAKLASNASAEKARYLVFLRDPTFWENFFSYLTTGEGIDVISRGEDAVLSEGADSLGGGVLSRPFVAIVADEEALSRIRDSEYVLRVVESERLDGEAVETRDVGLSAGASAWGLDRLDQFDSVLDGKYRYSTAGQGATAYILDTGIDSNNFSEFPPSRVEALSVWEGVNPRDCDGHGTHVAGTVAGTNYGVASGAQIVSIRLSGTLEDRCGGFDTVDIYFGMLLVHDHWVSNGRPPAVVNLSLGGPASIALDEDVAWLVQQGISVVAAAGNEGESACLSSPARSVQAITVAATGRNDVRPEWSNFGSCVDVFAPGADIVSAKVGGGYRSIDGTSMAAPHVTGLVTRFLGMNPRATPAMVRSAVIEGSLVGKVGSAGSGSPNRLVNSLFLEGSEPSFGEIPDLSSLQIGELVSVQLSPLSGRPPFSFTLTSGSLPRGLSMSSSGLIGGRVESYGNGVARIFAVDVFGRGATLSIPWSAKGVPDPTPIASGENVVEVEAGNRSITVSWTAEQVALSGVARGADVGWVRARAVDVGSNREFLSGWVDIRRSGSGSAVIAGLVNDQEYRVELMMWSFAASEWVAVVADASQRTPRPVAPTAPRSVGVSSLGPGQVLLGWSPPLSDGGSTPTYQVQVRLVEGEWVSVTECAELTVLQCAHQEGVPWGSSVQYRVRASNSQGDSGWTVSPVVVPRNVPDPTPIASGENVVEVEAGNRSITVSWTAEQVALSGVARGADVGWVRARAVDVGSNREFLSGWVDIRRSGSGSAVIAGLVNDQEYRVELMMWSFAASEWVAVVADASQRTPRAEGHPRVMSTPDIQGSTALGDNLRLQVGEISGTPSPWVTVLWYRCSEEPENLPSEMDSCEQRSVSSGYGPLPNISLQYQTDAGDLGHYIAAQISAGNSVGSVQTYAITQAKISSRPLIETGESQWSPEFPALGMGMQTHPAALASNWFAYPALTQDALTIQWLRCETAIEEVTESIPSDCVSLDNRTPTNEIIADDVGKFVTLHVRAINEIGATSLVLPRTVPVSSQIQMVRPPSILGSLIAPDSPADSKLLTIDTGEWTSNPEPSVRIDWISCNWPTASIDGGLSEGVPENCTVIAANQATFSLTRSNRGAMLSAIVTVTNPGSALSYVIPQAERVRYQPIAENLFLSVSGDTSSVGSELRLSDPRWTGLPEPEVSYQWYRCDYEVQGDTNGAVPSWCERIDVAENVRTYVTGNDDIGKTILATTSARNAVGASGPLRASSTTSVYTRRTIPGTSLLGVPEWDQDPFSSTFTSLVQESPRFTSINLSDVEYSWFQCASDPKSQLSGLRASSQGFNVPRDCDAIDGVTTPRLELNLSMVDYWTVLAVSFKAQIWSGQNVSFVVEVPSASPINSEMFPLIEALPGFAPRWSDSYGDVGVGQSIVYLFGSYPTCTETEGLECLTFEYVWKRNGQEIPGTATSTANATANYVLTPNDIGSSLSLDYRIQRHNHRSVQGSVNFPGSVVVGQITQAPEPTISGEQSYGETLTANVGTWDEGVALTYQWYRSGTPIAGAVGTAYQLTLDDIGSVISFRVEGSRNGYQTASRSASTATIRLGTLTYSSPQGPLVSGIPRVGETLRISAGSTTNQQQTASYRWDEGTTLAIQWFLNGTAIAGATSDSYRIEPEDVGGAISVSVTGSKTGYQTVVRSRVVTTSVALGRLISSVPTISGDPFVGEQLSAAPNSWTAGTAGVSQWFRDGEPIPNATGRTYTLTLDDLGSMISYSLTGIKEGYAEVTRTASLTSEIGISVSIAGNNINGTVSSTQSALTAQHVQSEGVSQEYQWFVCDSFVPEQSTDLPDGCSSAQYLSIPNNSKEAFLVGYTNYPAWGTPVHAGKFMVVGVKSTYGNKYVWNYSRSTSAVTDPPRIRGAISVDQIIELPEPSSFYWELVETNSLMVDPESAWSRIELNDEWDGYANWRQQDSFEFSVDYREDVNGYPTPWVSGLTWFVCSEAPLNPRSTSALNIGVQQYRTIPDSCESRGNSTNFSPHVSDSGKYVAVTLSYQNLHFNSRYFHYTGERVSLAPAIEPIHGAATPQIVGQASVGSTLEFQAITLGSGEIALDYQWFRCATDQVPAWSHNLPIRGTKVSDLGRKRMELVPVEDSQASWPNEAFRPFFVTQHPRCRAIPGAIQSTYTVTEDDRQSHLNNGSWITVFVTASNDFGSASYLAAPTGQIESSPYLEVSTREDGSAISPQLRCYTNSITNTHCRQDSGYVQGSDTIVKEFLPPVASADAISSESWRFRGYPAPELSHTWFLCDVRAPTYSPSLPDNCVEAPNEAGTFTDSGAKVFSVSSEWWGSWLVSVYSASNEHGALTQVASSVYLSGEPY